MELTGIQIGLQYSVMSTKKCRTTGGQDGWAPPSKYDFLFPSLLLFVADNKLPRTEEEQEPLTDPRVRGEPACSYFIFSMDVKVTEGWNLLSDYIRVDI